MSEPDEILARIAALKAEVAALREERDALAAKVEALADALERMLDVQEALMPGLAHIAVRNYAEVNEAPIAARAALARLEVKP